MKKKQLTGILTMVAGIVLCGVLLFAALWLFKWKKEEIVFSQDYIMTQELAPLLSFTYYSQEEWEERIGKFAKGKLNYTELEELLEELGVAEYVAYEGKAGFSVVSRKDFFQVYTQIVDVLDVDNQVVLENRVFIDEQEGDTDTWLTQMGSQPVVGGGQYIHTYDMYQVYTYNGAIIGIAETAKEPITWENIFVHTTQQGKTQLLFDKSLITIEVPQLTEDISDTVCDICWENNAVTAIYKKQETIQGTVLSYDQQQIEISGYGTLNHSGNLKIYKTYGTVEQLDESKLLIGNLVADFVVAEKEICGIILREPAEMKNIRVLLLNGESPYHGEVYLVSDEETTVTFQENKQTVPAGTMIKAADYWQQQQEGYLRIDTATPQGKLFLTNASAEITSLEYTGGFEIRKYSQGYCVVNDLSLEEYLYSVVPSEMPASYEMEALRAQAICARSYACIQLSKNEYTQFGANVDDSTNYQVYNKQEKNEKTTLAVQDTVGEVMFYNGAIAEAYYYSTSCGFSQNIDVWNMVDDGTYGYLNSVSLLTQDSQLDFSNEQVFGEFIQNKEYSAYDSDVPYFRWRAELDVSANLEEINNAVSERKQINANHVQVYDKNGNLIDGNPKDLGAIVGIGAEERSQGGVLKKIRLQYEKGSVLLTTEYNIRKVLGAAATVMTDKDEKEITAMSLLPSAAFTVIPVEQGYVLYGGGYGHGIGMSQNGANGMAKAGFSYLDILQKFYQNITIENIYNEGGNP